VAGIRPREIAAAGQQRVCVSRSADKRLLVTGDDKGLLKLFRYPCTSAFASFAAATGHSNPITDVAFAPDSLGVVSVGGGEGPCVIQWQVVKGSVGGGGGGGGGDKVVTGAAGAKPKTPKELAHEEIDKRQRKLQNALLAMKLAQASPESTATLPVESIPASTSTPEVVRSLPPSDAAAISRPQTAGGGGGGGYEGRVAGISSDAAARKSGDQPWRYDADADNREWRRFWS
jgi:WD40 repeat protein